MSTLLRNLLKKIFSLREKRETEAVKPFLEHLEDLRGMLFKIVITLGLTMMACFGFRKQLMHVIELPLFSIPGFGMHMLRGLAPGDSMTISLHLSFYAGIIISFPLLIYYLADFVLPALTASEKKLVLPGVGVAFGLFLTGVLFCFKVVLPMTLRWLWFDQINMGMSPDWTVGLYIGFATQFVVIFGLTFDLPVLVIALVKIGLLNATLLRRTRAYAVAIILIFAAFVAPSGDPITLGVFAGPMYLLYELCIWIAYYMERAEKRRLAAGPAGPN